MGQTYSQQEYDALPLHQKQALAPIKKAAISSQRWTGVLVIFGVLFLILAITILAPGIALQEAGLVAGGCVLLVVSVLVLASIIMLRRYLLHHGDQSLVYRPFGGATPAQMQAVGMQAISNENMAMNFHY